ncbi:MAG: S-layer homology domain-containing protein [Candidatus Altimarinota bacterium]
MFIDLPLPPPAVVQVVEESSEGAGLGAFWDVTGWTFVIPMLEGNQPYMGNNPLVVLDKDGNEVEIGENSYKVPGLLEYKNPDYFIIMDEPAFLASGYKIALKKGASDVILGIASYTEEQEITNEFQVSNVSSVPNILNLEKVKEEGTLLLEATEIASMKTEVNEINRDDLRVEAEVSSEELKIPEKPKMIEFADVKSPLLREAISYLVEKGIINGYPDGTFQPDKVINRAETLKIVFASVGVSPKLPSNMSPFSDVDENEWYFPYVVTAKFEGIIQGYEDDTYRPTSAVNKVEFLKIALSAQFFFRPSSGSYSSALKQFSDLDKSQWYMPYVNYAVEHEYLDDTTKFKPTEGMTRGEAAMIIYRILKEQE